MCQIATTFEVPLEKEGITSIYRPRPYNKNSATRAKLIDQSKTKCGFSTKMIGWNEEQPLYIRELLSKNNRQIHSAAFELRRIEKI